MMTAQRPYRLILAGVMLLFASPFAWALGLGLAPSRMELVVEPGTHLRKTVRVANFDPKRKLALTVSLADWRLNPAGEVIIAPPDSGPHSAAGWINFSPASLLVKPKEGQQIVLDIKVPAQLTGDKHYRDYRAALLVDTLLPPVDERAKQGSGVWHKYRVSSLLYFSVPPFAIEPELKALHPATAKDGQPAIELVLSNSGNTHARLHGEISLFTPGAARVYHQKLENIVVLEQHTLNKKIPLSLEKALLTGKYSVEVSLTGVDPQDKQVPVRFAEDFAPLTLELPQ